MANWVVDNLENALDTWNDKLSEIWNLVTLSPQYFKKGDIWSVMVNINGAVQAIGYALLGLLVRARLGEIILRQHVYGFFCNFKIKNSEHIPVFILYCNNCSKSNIRK